MDPIRTPAINHDNSPTERVHSLDGLRGIAALFVVLHHFASLRLDLPYPAWIRLTPLRIVADGHGPVLVFFALSGFVLFRSVTSAARFDYRAYLVQRFTRLYVPFAAAIVAAALLFILVDPKPIPSLTGWFNGTSWQRAPSLSTIGWHLGLTDDPNLQGLDNVMWSLVQEIRVSLLFPLLVFCIARNWSFTLATTLGLSVLGQQIYLRQPYPPLFDPAITMQYLFLFAGGAALSLNARALRERIEGRPRSQKLLLWAAALLLLTFSLNRPLFFAAQAAALVIVALVFGDPSADSVFSQRPALWLGRVSYSLYLIHMPILLAIVHASYGRLALPYIVAIAFVASLLAAELSYRFIELPSMMLARRWSAAIRGNPSARAVLATNRDS